MATDARKKPGKIRRFGRSAKQFAALRREMGLTQEELAQRLKANRSQVAAWEGGVEKPSAERLIELANSDLSHSLKLRLWKLAGIEESVLLSAAAEEMREQFKTPEAAHTLAVPVFDELADSIDHQVERVLLPAKFFGDGKLIVAFRFPAARGFPSVFSEGDILVLDGSEPEPLALIGRLVLVLLDPFPEGYEMDRAASDKARDRLRDAPRIAYSDLHDPDPQPAAEEAYRVARRAGHLAGWIEVQHAEGEARNIRRNPSGPWRLVLQLSSNERYQGSLIDLTGWQNQGSPDQGNPSKYGPLIPKGTQIVGRIVGWMSAPRAKVADSLIDSAVSK